MRARRAITAHERGVERLVSSYPHQRRLIHAAQARQRHHARRVVRRLFVTARAERLARLLRSRRNLSLESGQRGFARDDRMPLRSHDRPFDQGGQFVIGGVANLDGAGRARSSARPAAYAPIGFHLQLVVAIRYRARRASLHAPQARRVSVAHRNAPLFVHGQRIAFDSAQHRQQTVDQGHGATSLPPRTRPPCQQAHPPEQARLPQRSSTPSPPSSKIGET